MYDLIVIGGGPGGYMAAERAGQAGLGVLLIEKRALGGVCLNEGCIPSKTLLNSAKIYDHTKHGEAYGVMADNARIDHAAVVTRKNAVVKKLVGGVQAAMKSANVTVVYGVAYIEGIVSGSPHDTIRVRVDSAEDGGTHGETYSGSRLLIATGSAPVIPRIEGVEEGLKNGSILTSREILDLEEVPARLAVIGGGVIGLEMAAYFNSAGSKVTVIEMLPDIGGAIDGEISGVLKKSYEKKGVEFLLSTCAAAFDGQGARYRRVNAPEGEADRTAPYDKALLSIGRRPVTQGFGLENTGVVVERGAILTDQHGRTSVPNIYAVGDVNGQYMLAHAAYREAEVAVNHMLGRRDVMRYCAVPSVIYTSPEVACVGETEESAKAKGVDCACASVPMVYSGRYIAENDMTDGLCKVVIDKACRNIIGVHMIGGYASEIIISACMMIEMQMRVDDVRELVFPHPTVSEIIREAVFRL